MPTENNKKTKHIALVDINIGSKKDGSPKKVIKKGNEYLLTKAEVLSYKSQKII